MNLVGRRAPDFTVPAVLASGDIIDDFHLLDEVKNKYCVLFFYPLDFTFVCPSELIALDRRVADFKKREVEIIGISVDSQFTHHAWRNTAINQGGIGPVGYTLAADVGHHVCQSYGIEHPDMGVALRAAFLIDQSGVIRAQVVNDLSLGRSIDELIRLIDALQYHEKHGEVCPAGWQKGQRGMVASPEGVAAYLAEYAEQL